MLKYGVLTTNARVTPLWCRMPANPVRLQGIEWKVTPWLLRMLGWPKFRYFEGGHSTNKKYGWVYSDWPGPENPNNERYPKDDWSATV